MNENKSLYIFLLPNSFANDELPQLIFFRKLRPPAETMPRAIDKLNLLMQFKLIPPSMMTQLQILTDPSETLEILIKYFDETELKIMSLMIHS